MDVNLLAVLLAGVASMILGAFWYSPAAFGKQWMSLMGMTAADIKKAKQKGMAKEYVMNFISALVMAFVLAAVLGMLGTSGMGEVIQTVFWLWLGFIGTVTFGSILWEGKSCKLWVLNNAYWFLNLIIMGLIITAI